jgi:SNF2 family DNA or RNA helicase
MSRVLIEVAHLIRNASSRMARATCALSSVSRWAVTGTPIQNRLGDLSTLLKFIRVYPYTDPKCFDRDISHLWKSGKDEMAVKRLKRLSACLLLRRAKETVTIPVRRDMRCPVDFTPAERRVYDEIRQQTITKIDEALLQNSEVSRSGVYVNVLQQIESLRMVCNLGLYYRARHDGPLGQQSQEANEWAGLAQRTFNVRRAMELIVCSQCWSSLDLIETSDEQATRESPQFSRCFKFTCSDCLHKLGRAGRTVGCGHSPSCPVAPVSVSSSTRRGVGACSSSNQGAVN